MDDKIERIRTLQAQRKELDDEIGKLAAEVNAEVSGVLNAGKKPRKKKGETT